MNTFRNIVLSLCIGSLAAIVINIQMANGTRFSSTAFAIGFFIFSAVFAVKPIRLKARLN